MLATTACHTLTALTSGHPIVQFRAAAAGVPEALTFLCTAGTAAIATAPAAAALAAACHGHRAAASAAAAGGAADVLTALLPARGAAAAAAAVALAALAESSNRGAAAVDSAGAASALGACLEASAISTASPATQRVDSALMRSAVRLIRSNPDRADALVSAGAAQSLACMLQDYLNVSTRPDDSMSHSASQIMWCIVPVDTSQLPEPSIIASYKPPSTSTSPAYHPLDDSENISAVHGTPSANSCLRDGNSCGHLKQHLPHEHSSRALAPSNSPSSPPLDAALCVSLKLIPERVRGQLQRPKLRSVSGQLRLSNSVGLSSTIQKHMHASFKGKKSARQACLAVRVCTRGNIQDTCGGYQYMCGMHHTHWNRVGKMLQS
jgi:hypothetical protein